MYYVKASPYFRHCSDGVSDWPAQAAPHLESHVGNRGKFGLPSVEETFSDYFSFIWASEGLIGIEDSVDSIEAGPNDLAHPLLLVLCWHSDEEVSPPHHSQLHDTIVGNVGCIFYFYLADVLEIQS